MNIKSIADELQPKSMAARDWVFHVIRTAIVRGILPGGMPLRQDEISSALNVSHIPVREAFRQLEAQGLVRIFPNRGAFVTKLTREELSNLMDIRIILELGALRNGMPFMTDAIVEKAFAFHSASLDEEDQNICEDLNQKLHFTLYGASHNPILLEDIDKLHANVDRYIRAFYAKPEINIKSQKDHKDLIDACAKRDTELASAVLRTHLELSKDLALSSPAFK